MISDQESTGALAKTLPSNGWKYILLCKTFFYFPSHVFNQWHSVDSRCACEFSLNKKQWSYAFKKCARTSKPFLEKSHFWLLVLFSTLVLNSACCAGLIKNRTLFFSGRPPQRESLYSTNVSEKTTITSWQHLSRWNVWEKTMAHTYLFPME